MHGKKLKREKGDIAKASQATSGIKSLSKEKREMLEVCRLRYQLHQRHFMPIQSAS